MEWLLGGGLAASVAGLIYMGVTIARQSSRTREDLKLMRQTAERLADREHTLSQYKQAVATLENSFAEKQQELETERNARWEVEKAFADLQRVLSSDLPRDRLADYLRSTLRRLSEVPKVSGTRAARGHTSQTLYGAASVKDQNDGQKS